jgi:hypothetical protein
VTVSLPRWKSAWKRRRVKYLPGTPILGFHGLFEADYGDPNTKEPYVRVTPSKLGSLLLPFKCPECKQVNYEFSDARRRAMYKDPRPGRTNHWCPMCKVRFCLVEEGMPLPKALPPGAAYAPARVDRGGEVSFLGKTMIGHWMKSIFGEPTTEPMWLDALLWRNDTLEPSAVSGAETKVRAR